MGEKSYKNNKQKKDSFWATIPDYLKGIAAILAAFVGLLTFLYTGPLKPQPKLTDTPMRIRSVSELPVQGELIIPKGYLFNIPDGMTGTTWYFPSSNTEDDIIKFSNSLASDRAKKYGGSARDYPVIIWMGKQLPASIGSTCSNQYDNHPGVGVSGTGIGDQNCFQMLEYRLTK